jgi:hypothetical protein
MLLFICFRIQLQIWRGEPEVDELELMKRGDAFEVANADVVGLKVVVDVPD